MENVLRGRAGSLLKPLQFPAEQMPEHIYLSWLCHHRSWLLHEARAKPVRVDSSPGVDTNQVAVPGYPLSHKRCCREPGKNNSVPENSGWAARDFPDTNLQQNYVPECFLKEKHSAALK